ncbi:MAG: aminopeptidase P family N-terminal domain-containing protein, partial [Alphaproteobacteria bacterium]
MALHFTEEEFAARKSRLTALMTEDGLDALLMFRQESMYWLTGYDTFGFVFFQTLVLTADGRVVLMTRAPDLRQAQNTSNIGDIRIWVDRDGASPADDLCAILDELGLKGGKL